MMQTSCIENRKIVITVFGGGQSSWQIGPFVMALETILSEWNGTIELVICRRFCRQKTQHINHSANRSLLVENALC